MKIRKLQLKNIGVFDDETIEFQHCPAKDKAEIHIFTGENGTGKTTLLTVLASTFDGRANEENLLFELKKRVNKLYKGSWKIDFNNEIVFEQKLSDPFESTTFGSSKIDKLSNYQRLNSYNSGSDLLNFAVFAYSGNRIVKNEDIEFFRPYRENPLKDSLNFVKDYTTYSINQWIAHNLSSRAIEKEKQNIEKANRFAKNIQNFQEVIEKIIDYKIEFVLDTGNKSLLVKLHNEEIGFDVLPSGLQSLISWVGDLLMRLDNLKWADDLPVFEKNLILFLDEIEVHLHPAWQRKVLPVVQKLFKNSQIFVSTHSPFVVNSIDDAWVYKLKLENGKAKVADIVRSEDGISYQTVLSEIFGIDEEFGGKTQEDLDKFYEIVRNGKKIKEKELLELAKSLAVQSEELNSIVQIELRQLSRRKGQEFSL